MYLQPGKHIILSLDFHMFIYISVFVLVCVCVYIYRQTHHSGPQFWAGWRHPN